MKDVDACKRCGDKAGVIVDRMPYYRAHSTDIVVIYCSVCGNIECAPTRFGDIGAYGDRYADAAIERWNAQPNPFGWPSDVRAEQ